MTDDEYIRNGVASIFIEVEPLSQKKCLMSAIPIAKKWFWSWTISIHNTASLYEAFQPEEARRLAERLEIHYRPKHGSWLNIAEIDSVFLRGNALPAALPSLRQCEPK